MKIQRGTVFNRHALKFLNYLRGFAFPDNLKKLHVLFVNTIPASTADTQHGKRENTPSLKGRIKVKEFTAPNLYP